MVERDIVYEVIPHYQRRRLHAKLAQELEKSLEEQHVATLTTIAYHWNQACMGHEVTEVECSLKAIEFWCVGSRRLGSRGEVWNEGYCVHPRVTDPSASQLVAIAHTHPLLAAPALLGSAWLAAGTARPRRPTAAAA